MGANLNSGGGRGRGYRRNQFTEINVTPFVDVMLVLLVIFMVTAPMMTTGVTVDLPDTEASAIKGDDEPMSVSIKKDGSVYIQDLKIPVNELGPKLTAITAAKAGKETRIFVRGDQQVDYGRVMEVMGIINASGFLKVALISEQAKSSSRKRRR